MATEPLRPHSYLTNSSGNPGAAYNSAAPSELGGQSKLPKKVLDLPPNEPPKDVVREIKAFVTHLPFRN